MFDTTRAETKEPGRLTSEFLSGTREMTAGVFVDDVAILLDPAA